MTIKDEKWLSNKKNVLGAKQGRGILPNGIFVHAISSHIHIYIYTYVHTYINMIDMIPHTRKYARAHT